METDPCPHRRHGKDSEVIRGSLGKSLGSIRRGRWAKEMGFLLVFKKLRNPVPPQTRHLAMVMKWFNDEELSFN